MNKPKGLSDTLLTHMLLVQLGGDGEVLVFPVSVTQVLTPSAGDLDDVSSQPDALPEICAHLIHCRWHVYSFLRDKPFLGVLFDRGDSTTNGNVWYVDSLKSDGSSELAVVLSFLEHGPK